MPEKILLVGNPNVGKSVLFSRLTSIHVISSNYPGTTVDFTEGNASIAGEKTAVLDVPGTYSLTPASAGEEVAVRMIEEGGRIVNVLDTTNLERNLFLTLQLLDKGLAIIVVLNMWDDAQHRGISINVAKLSEELGVPVVPTVAVTGQGIRELIAHIPLARKAAPRIRTDAERWAEIGRILKRAQSLEHRHHTLGEWLGDLTVQPFPGMPLAAAIIVASFLFVRVIGESLIAYIFDPIFDSGWKPLMSSLSVSLGSEGFLHSILIGQLIGGAIDLKQSFGLLTTGIYVELGMVLPYLISFYLALGLLEDSGYLPRLAVMMDTVMHRVGLHGWAIIPTMLGLGCNVPGIMATRMLESERERLIAATLISIGIPCVALQAMIFGLVGQRGIHSVVLIYASLLLAWLIIGRMLNAVLPGRSPELLMEIPPYRLPPFWIMAKKLRFRIVQFICEATPLVLGGILLVNILTMLRVFECVAMTVGPLLTKLWGIPPEAIVPLAVGFLRKDVAVGMLNNLGLTDSQMIISTVTLAMTFPCVATFIVMLRELGWRGLLKSVGIMLVCALLFGVALNALLRVAGME